MPEILPKKANRVVDREGIYQDNDGLGIAIPI